MPLIRSHDAEAGSSPEALVPAVMVLDDDKDDTRQAVRSTHARYRVRCSWRSGRVGRFRCLNEHIVRHKTEAAAR